MLFTIDIEIFSLIYRLDQKGNFARVEDRESTKVLSEDMIFQDYQSAKLYKSKMGEKIVVDGKEVNCNSDSHTFGEPYVTINLHRTQKPRQDYFTREQVNRTLLLGDDNRHNQLVIDFDGYVHLIPHGETNETYAVRYETFIAGNGYVGEAWEGRSLEDLYESLLQGWYTHLTKDETVYIDYSNGTNAEKSIEDILEILK